MTKDNPGPLGLSFGVEALTPPCRIWQIAKTGQLLTMNIGASANSQAAKKERMMIIMTTTTMMMVMMMVIMMMMLTTIVLVMMTIIVSE